LPAKLGSSCSYALKEAWSDSSILCLEIRLGTEQLNLPEVFLELYEFTRVGTHQFLHFFEFFRLLLGFHVNQVGILANVLLHEVLGALAFSFSPLVEGRFEKAFVIFG